MPQTLPLTTHIDESSSMKRTFRVKRVEFGNGYEQVAPDGINSSRDEWSVVYRNLTSAERDTLLNVLNAAQGWDYISWQAPGDAASKKWRINNEYSMSTNGNLWSVTVPLLQVY